MIDISIVIPVFNEEKSIILLLKSLMQQSYKPDEILISDGGSTDNTIANINKLDKKNFNIKIYNRIGKCRGAGRNEGIKNAKNKLIALIDAGTYPDKYWLERLSKPIIDNNKIEIVYGAAKPITDTLFKKSIASVIISKNNYSGLILPTVSSIIFKKNIWDKKKFPESIDGEYIVEDLIFLRRIKSLNANSKIIYNAVVNWDMPSSIKMVFKRFVNLSRGGIKAGFAKTWHYGVLRNMIIFSLLIIFSFLISYLFIFITLFFIFIRTYMYTKYLIEYKKNSLLITFNQFLLTAFLLILIDIASINGFFKWMFLDKFKKLNL